MSVSDYPYSSTGGALLWRMLLRSLSLWSQFGPCVQLWHLPTTMIHSWFKILLYRCLKSWYSFFSNLNLSVSRTHFQSSTVKFWYFLASLKRWSMLIFWWCCRFGSAGSCFGYIRSGFSEKLRENDFWPPSFFYSLNPQTFSPFPSFRDNTRNCRHGLRLLDPRLTTTHTPKQEQKVVKKKYS